MLSLLRFHCGTKGLALCGVLLPSTPLWYVLALLCAAALRYSSLMFQAPHWTSIKALEYPIWSSCALSPPVRCCLPAPCLLSLCGLFLCPCVVLPPPLCPLSSRVDVPVFPGCVRDVWDHPFSGRFLAFCRSLSVLRSAASLLNSFSFVCALQSLWSLVFSLPPLVLLLPLRFWPWWSSGFGGVLWGPFVGVVLWGFQRGSRTSIGAMDWTALQ